MLVDYITKGKPAEQINCFLDKAITKVLSKIIMIPYFLMALLFSASCNKICFQ